MRLTNAHANFPKRMGMRGKFASQNFGAVAQLGERLHGMQEVVGSIPISSTLF